MSAVATAFTREDAERLTERVRMVATTLMEAREKLMKLLDEALAQKVWEPLGMRSLDEWTKFTFSETPLARLSREDRKVLVGDMAERGMSSRSIAPVVGASHMTVARDIEASVTDVTDAPRTVNGIDGIARTFQPKPPPEAPEPTAPSRDLTIVNDIRLYLVHIAKSKDVANLPPAGKQHIINALEETLNSLRSKS